MMQGVGRSGSLGNESEIKNRELAQYSSLDCSVNKSDAGGNDWGSFEGTRRAISARERRSPHFTNSGCNGVQIQFPQPDGPEDDIADGFPRICRYISARK